MTSIPKYLYSLPEGIFPPAQSKLQELPFNDLTWENFERLVLRYVEQIGKLEHCHLYGQRGQKQEGIDLFIRHNSDDLYSVYQCKRYKEYSVTNLQNAVKEFKKGTWFDRSKRFYICTSCDLSEKKLSDEIEVQKNILEKDGIELLVLDKVKLSNKLKALPQVVYDFFGKEWTRLFCGEEYLSNIGDRLEPKQISEYRNKLGNFYNTLFENHESSLRNISGQKSTPRFTERYITPDINQNFSFDYTNDHSSEKAPTKDRNSNSSPAEFLDELDTDYENLEKISNSYIDNSTNIENRMCAVDWLASEHNSLVVGGPGSGKSALLKYIILGLLDQIEINNDNFIQSKNTLIPVWLPFSYWSNYLEANPNSSIINCLHSWFSGMAHEDLWPLIETAIKDNRLLLVVDGIDEWKSEQSALICIQKLAVFISERNASSIISSRPSGVDKLGLTESSWSAAHLVGLSFEQQNKLINSCIEYRLKNQTKIDDSTLRFELSRLSQELISEISVSQDLSELASVPLLLYMLIHLKSKNISLPHSRFKVYRDLINDLVKVQPKRRRTAAQVINSIDIFSETELISILAKLAFELHVQYPHGSINIDVAKTIICDYLTDENIEFGFPLREAQKHAESFLDISESEVGILVKKSPNEMGFFHRALQEFLAAYYISTQPDDNQQNALKEYMFNKQWKDVFLGLFTLLERPSDVEKLVNFVTNYKCHQHEGMQKEAFLAEIAFGDNKCSASIAKTIAHSTFEVIENGPYTPHRRALLNILLSGFKSNKLNEEIVEKIDAWAPENSNWFNSFFESIEEHWPTDNLTRELLLKAVELDGLTNKRAAGRAIVRKFSRDKNVLSTLIKKIKLTLCFDTRMVLCEAAIRGWPDTKEVKSICKNLSTIKSPVSELLIILYETLNSITTDGNRKKLLEIAGQSHVQLDYPWSAVAEECIELSYLGDELKDKCFNRVFQNTGNIELDFAINILTSHYYKDESVLRNIIEDLKQKHPKILMGFNRRETKNLEQIIQHSPEAYSALENMIINEPYLSYSYYRLINTQRVKAHLIKEAKKADSFCFWAIEALITNWGIEDKEVKLTIEQMISDTTFNASVIAHLYPTIFVNKIECFERLIKLLETDIDEKQRKRYDFIIKGILRVATDEQCAIATEILSRKLKVEKKSAFVNDDLLLLFGMSKITQDMKEIALKHLNERGGNLSLVAAIFNRDEAMRKKILQKFITLPASLRGIISNKLSQINTNQFAWQFLGNYDNEVDPAVKMSAAIGHYSSPLSSNSSEQMKKDLSQLKTEAIAVGPDYQDVRQAALCGFIALDRLDELNNLKVFEKDKSSLARLFDRSIRPNEVFYGYIAKNWDYIENKLDFGEKHPIRKDNNNFFTNIAPHIDIDSNLKRDFKQYLYDSYNGSNDRILMAASKFISKEQLLLKMCFQSLGLVFEQHKQTRIDSYRDSLLSIYILEQQFYGDTKAKSLLAEAYDNKLNNPDIILVTAHAIGYTDAPFMNAVKAKLKNRPMWLPAHFHLISHQRGNKKKIESIDRIIPHISNTPKQYARYFCKTMIEIVNGSESLYKELIKTVTSEKEIQRKLQFLVLLSHIDGVNPQIRELAIDLFNTQSKKRYCDSFYDITKGGYSTSLAALTNILYEE